MTPSDFTVALVGRPNVGKSTLFNRIARTRRAITYGEPGVTRDLVSHPAEYDGKRFLLVDTGGYDPGGGGDILAKVRGQVLRAIYESDVVLFIVDAKDGLLPLDNEIAGMLREREKRFLLVANKVDAKAAARSLDEFYELGVDRIFALSAEHGTGLEDVLEEVAGLVAASPPRQAAEEEIVARVAVVGRPNVGKSTLVNSLVGYERVIASEIPGTTRDSIDVLVRYGEKKYLFVDTAGIRPRRRTQDVLEKYSVIKSLDSIKRCDLAVLMVDGPEGVTHQDQQILRYILNEGRAVVVAANKADGWKSKDESAKGLRAISEVLEFAAFAPVVQTVATSGKGIPALFRKIENVFESFRRRISTGTLNRVASSSLYSVPIPSKRVRNRAFYITQVGVMPPSFAVFVKDRSDIPDSYTRFVQNTIRDRFGFEGSPVRIIYREK